MPSSVSAPAELRPQDAAFAREMDGTRWHRCLRCDSWLPFADPTDPTTRHPPAREEIELPLRGKPLRDKIVLRAIAVDRALHFLILPRSRSASSSSPATRSTCATSSTRCSAPCMAASAAPRTAPTEASSTAIDDFLNLPAEKLKLIAAALGAYALLQALEGVGLWLQKRWADTWQWSRPRPSCRSRSTS